MTGGEKLLSKLIVIASFFIMLFGGIWLNRANGEYVLKIGVYSGSYWGTPNSDSYRILDLAIARFEEMHPNIRVEYVSGIGSGDYSEWLAEQILRGTEPDLYFVLPEDFNLLASSGALADLTDMINRDTGFDTDVYYTSCLEAGKFNGIQYALPQESVPTIMFVNKTLLDEKGIKFPESDWTWDDFYEICSQVTDTENHCYGVFGYTWLNALYSNGTSLFSDDCTQCRLMDAQVLSAIRFTRSIMDLNEGYTVTAKDFDLGNVAFRPFLYSEYRGYQPYPWRVKVYTGFEWDGIPMPAGPEGGNNSELHTMLLGISSRTMHKDAAWQFARMLSSDPELQQALMRESSGISPLKAVAEAPESVAFMQENIPGGNVFDKNSIHEIMSSAVVTKPFRKYEQALSMADTAVSELVTIGTVSEDDLLNVQREINQFLK